MTTALIGCGDRAAVAPNGLSERTPRVSDGRTKPLVVMTYNVLADPIEADKRLKAIIDIILSNQPDIIALQEVAPWFLDGLLNDSQVSAAYEGASFGQSNPAPGGQYILSRYPIRESKAIRLSGRQGRTAIVVSIDIDGVETLVATTHMESALADGPIRAGQLGELFELVEGSNEAIVLGDFNFGDGENEESRIPGNFVDAWNELRQGDSGFTWNIESSPMAKRGSFPGEQSRRIDRVLFRTATYRADEIRIVGDKPISADGSLFPSDHFGLVATLIPVPSGK